MKSLPAYTIRDVPHPSQYHPDTDTVTHFIAPLDGIDIADEAQHHELQEDLEKSTDIVAAWSNNGLPLATAAYTDRRDGSGKLHHVLIAPEIYGDELDDALYREMGGVVIGAIETRARTRVESLVVACLTEDDMLLFGSLGYKPIRHDSPDFYKSF